jgi:hypothetical protein
MLAWALSLRGMKCVIVCDEVWLGVVATCANTVRFVPPCVLGSARCAWTRVVVCVRHVAWGLGHQNRGGETQKSEQSQMVGALFHG